LIASAISNGGFPPLLLQPIDFVGLYQRRLADTQGQQASTTA
jgi:preprotein translocase subunit SecB